MKKRLVAFDTQIIIWGLRNKYTTLTKKPSMGGRAEKLIRFEKAEGSDLAITSITLAELLAVEGLPNRFTRDLHELFKIFDFDATAALKMAEFDLKTRHCVPQRRDSECHDDKVCRGVYKNDQLIIGTCLAHGVDTLYSHDKGLRKLCEGILDIRDIPLFTEQLNIDGEPEFPRPYTP